MADQNDFFNVSQAATTTNEATVDQINLPDILFQNLRKNLKRCEIYDLCNQNFQFNSHSSELIVHLNTSSLQARFDELNEFLNYFSRPPSIILLSETRINVNPSINISIPAYSSIPGYSIYPLKLKLVALVRTFPQN